uniref:zinc ribbon domain-containing protein n=1 Tax=Eubacterium sp. AF05-24 TaxID=2996995 RepID=UPI0022E1E17C
QMPFQKFIKMIKYKAEAVGIKVMITEESYTSKASSIDEDQIPCYGEEEKEYTFSGKRIKRGLYRSKEGILMNADINGASNIIEAPCSIAGSSSPLIMKMIIMKSSMAINV